MLSKLEEIVSYEAAINHCLMENIMKYKYVVITTYPHIPVFHDGPEDLNQVIKTIMEPKIHGYRISMDDQNNKPSMMVKPREVLATAANHFIPLSARTTFRTLKHVTMKKLDSFLDMNDSVVVKVKEYLKKGAARRMKAANISLN